MSTDGRIGHDENFIQLNETSGNDGSYTYTAGNARYLGVRQQPDGSWGTTVYW